MNSGLLNKTVTYLHRFSQITLLIMWSYDVQNIPQNGSLNKYTIMAQVHPRLPRLIRPHHA